MLPNQNLSKADAKWLLNDFSKLVGGSIFGKNVDSYTRAINLIRGTNVTRPGCSCEFKLHGQTAMSLFDQYKSEIENIANAV